MTKGKLAFLNILFAFVVLLILNTLGAFVGLLLNIPWLIHFTDSGFLVGNIFGALLGIYNIITPIKNKEAFKDVGQIYYYLILIVGVICCVLNSYELFKYFYGFEIWFL